MEKKKLLFLSLASALLFAGCANNLEEIEPPMNDFAPVQANNCETIGKYEALKIANQALNKVATRSIENDMPVFDYILKKPSNPTGPYKSKSASHDTLAYVLNYPNEGGFAVIASSKNVSPVLAFSDKGHFDKNNKAVKSNFIDKIETYVNEPQTRATSGKLEDFKNFKVEVEPCVKINLTQNSPWNKFVVKEHPGCGVGSMAVAVATVMSYSRDKLCSKTPTLYHGRDFNFSLMNEYIEKYQRLLGGTTQSASDLNRIIGDDDPYGTTTAIDDMAKLLYYVGKDIGTKYKVDNSSAPLINAYRLLVDSLNFSSPSGFIKDRPFYTVDLSDYLYSDCLVIAYGPVYDLTEDDYSGSYAWVIDGWGIWSASKVNPILTEYYHCKWGGASSDGYYSGGVFNIGDKTITATGFIAIHRENVINNITPPISGEL